MAIFCRSRQSWAPYFLGPCWAPCRGASSVVAFYGAFYAKIRDFCEKHVGRTVAWCLQPLARVTAFRRARAPAG
jgi:hypothetical protein